MIGPVDPVTAFEKQRSLEEELFIDIPDVIPDPDGMELLKSPTDYTMELIDHFSSDPNSKGGWLPYQDCHEFRVRPGELTVIAGQNFAGKSAIMTQIMTNLIRPDNLFSDREEKYLLISPEFSPKINLARIVQQVIGKMPKEITAPEVGATLAFLAKKMLILDVVGMVEADRVANIIHWASQEYKITGTIIDNLTVLRLNGRGSGDNDAMSDLMARLVEVARISQTHIWLVAHQRKPSANEKPNRYSIRGASQITDLADNVLLVERFELKERKLEQIDLDIEERRGWESSPDTFLHISKQRHGSAWTGRIKLYYDKESMRWSSQRNVQPMSFEEIKDLTEATGGPQNNIYRSW